MINMIDKGELIQMKAKGEIILSNATYKKQVEIGDNEYIYKGKTYKFAHWLLTWGHEQFYWLTDKYNNLNTCKLTIGD